MLWGTTKGNGCGEGGVGGVGEKRKRFRSGEEKEGKGALEKRGLAED